MHQKLVQELGRDSEPCYFREHVTRREPDETRQDCTVGAADTDDGNPVYQLESGYRKSFSLESSAVLDVFSLVP